jgi:hypothetical protein
MIVATQATQNAAYDACISAKIARQTLLEYQSGESDSHSIAAGTVAQASVAIREQTGFLSTNVTRLPTVQQPGTISAAIESAQDWKALDLAFTYANMGKSSIRNVRLRYTVQILPHGIEPKPTDKNLYFDTVRGTIVHPGELSMTKINIIDKDNKIVKVDDISMDEFHSGKIYIASFGRADYIDIFGVSHWQTFCGYFDTSQTEFEGGVAKLKHVKCSEYNRQDSNILYPMPTVSPSTILPSSIENIVCVAPKH